MSIELDFGDGTELDTWVSVLGPWYGDITFKVETGCACPDHQVSTVWGKIGYVEGKDGLFVKDFTNVGSKRLTDDDPRMVYPIDVDDIIKVVIS